MTKKKVLAIIISLILITIIITISIVGIDFYIITKYKTGGKTVTNYKSFSDEVSLEKSMRKYYDVKVPILDDAVFEFKRARYEVNYRYNWKDVIFNQKKLRKSGLCFWDATVAGAKYAIGLKITADYYNDFYDKPTIISQYEELIPRTKGEDDKIIVMTVAYQNTKFKISTEVRLTDNPNATTEGAYEVLQSVKNAIN